MIEQTMIICMNGLIKIVVYLRTDVSISLHVSYVYFPPFVCHGISGPSFAVSLRAKSTRR